MFRYTLIAIIFVGGASPIHATSKPPKPKKELNKKSNKTKLCLRHIEQLQTNDHPIRVKTANQLATHACQESAALPALRSALKRDKNENVRLAIATSLAQMGPKVVAFASELDYVLRKDKSAQVRLAVVRALNKLGKHIPKAVFMLKGAVLSDQDIAVRMAAAKALVHVVDQPIDAIPVLQQMLYREANKDVVKTIAMMLGQMGEVGISQLTIALNGENRITRLSAAMALGKIGTPAATAAPQLTLALQEDDNFVRWMVTWAIGEIGPQAASASTIVALQQVLLGDTYQKVRKEAAIALGKLGPKAAKALRSLEKAKTSDPSYEVRSSARLAIKKIKPRSKSNKKRIMVNLPQEKIT